MPTLRWSLVDQISAALLQETQTQQDKEESKEMNIDETIFKLFDECSAARIFEEIAEHAEKVSHLCSHERATKFWQRAAKTMSQLSRRAERDLKI